MNILDTLRPFVRLKHPQDQPVIYIATMMSECHFQSKYVHYKGPNTVLNTEIFFYYTGCQPRRGISLSSYL